MKIRSATAQDTEAIVLLLKQSLGESLIKKTTSIWQFKHQDNPFGVSHVLVAEEKNSLIGVRAFMQWHWQLGDTIQTAYRAVDTATHPSHQGKGVFKKLTLQALEEVAQKQARFIFNTPNSQSLPGYLKMGWKEVDKINVALVPAIVYYFRFLFSSSTRRHSISETKLEELCQLHNQALSQKKMLFTPKTLQYLKWRYEINPMQDYMVYSGSDWYVAIYVKKHRYFREVRVAEVIGSFEKKNLDQIRNVIVHYAFKNRCFLITTADKFLFGLRLYGKFGPKLTFRPLTEDVDFNDKALNIQNWHYSLGDLELF